ncbi:MAG TPA: SRPBCC domain-containing protein [Thermoanaerobaculia bacterium]|nr:SRPBCC domain-containing protein [Thermoanaerobaculia bacterium]
MSVRHDDTVPVRFIEVEVEVPGTPEEVWQTIATGPGFTAWFCPTTLEEREGGTVTFRMGPGMESKGVVTAWEPPRRFVAEERWMPDAPPCATEIIVEAQAGGTCRVRLVNSLFTSKADWDDQLEGLEQGWPGFFEILRLYRTHFPGEVCAPVQALSISKLDGARVWAELLAGLNLAGAAAGDRRSTAGSGAPRLVATVESVREGKNKMIILRTEEPAAGVAAFGTGDCGPMGLMIWAALYLYGESAATVADSEGAKWQEWLSERFPAPAPESADEAGAVEAAS